MKQKDILIILFLLLICVVVWAGTSIYRNLAKSTISDTTNQDILPIAPTFDVQTVNKIKNRVKIDPAFILTPLTPTPTSISTLGEEEASEGGEISQ